MMYGGSAPVAAASGSQVARMAFVRKVYGLFFISILISVFTGFLSIRPDFIETAWNLHAPLWGVTLLIVLAFRWTKRVPGLNLFMLYLFSALWGVILGPVFFIYQMRFPGLPLQAGTLATAVFGGLTAYVFLTKQDFNFLGGFLIAGLIALIVGWLMLMFFPVAVGGITTLWCIVGVLIFAGFVLYDTSNILTRLNYDEAPLGALELYLDFLNLVMFIMRLLGGSRR